MCGITGLVAKEVLSPQDILQLTNAIQHRGPDGEGYVAVNLATQESWPLTGPDSPIKGPQAADFLSPAHLFLGHRRLSILDPTPAGHQPMATPDHQLWITFNGEIYNYKSLRALLQKQGVVFKTDTDTEVLLHGYRAWGQDLLEKIEGMWALVIYDQKQKKLFGARDRFGVKPLYYTQQNNRFAFASELKALAALKKHLKTELHRGAAFEYLAFGWQEREPQGFFKNFIELQPAHAFEFDLTSHTLLTWQYYQLPFTNSQEAFHPDQAHYWAKEVQRALIQSVESHLISDVPVGSCLSGGIDSSAIVSILHQLMKKQAFAQLGSRQKAFTATYPGTKVDEAKWARLVAEQTGCEWHRTTPTAKAFAQDLEDLVYTQDFPFNNFIAYSQFRVMKLASEAGVKVLLDGQGADEIFGGYKEHYRAFFIEQLLQGRGRQLLQECRHFSNAQISASEGLKSILKLGLGLLPKTIGSHLIHTQYGTNRFLKPSLWSEFQDREALVWNRVILSLQDMLVKDVTGTGLKTLLRNEDRASMRFSIETRTPFADDRALIELAFRIPSVYKIQKGWSKAVLRQSMTDILPPEIQWRRDKIGFSAPETWMKENSSLLLSYVEENMGEWVDLPSLKQHWISILYSGDKAALWRIINLGIWKKVYGL